MLGRFSTRRNCPEAISVAKTNTRLLHVTPAKAGVQSGSRSRQDGAWIPAVAGMRCRCPSTSRPIVFLVWGRPLWAPNRGQARGLPLQ